MVFDTNILIHAVNQNSEWHVICTRKLQEALRGASSHFLTWSICYEFLRVSSHQAVFPSPLTSESALRFLNALLDSPNLGLLLQTGQHQALLTRTLTELPETSGNLMHDLHTAVLMREYGIREICTLDRDFLRFPFLTVIDPRA